MTKRVKITLLIFGLIGVTLLLTHNYINRKICNAIEVKIKSQTGGEYDIKINSISLNPFSSNCKINNIELNSTNIKADIGNITIIGIGLRKFISNHDIELKNIIIKSPKIDFIPITRKTIKKSKSNNKPKK